MIDFSEDSKLLEEITKNNKDALEYLYHCYFKRLHNYAFRYTEDEKLAEDIVQECYIKLWEESSELKAVSIKSLLFTMVRNKCLNFLKKQNSVKKLQMEFLSQLKNTENLYHKDFYANDNESYLKLEQQIEFAISTLPSRCKEVFILSRYDKMKNKGIAEKLGISTTSVEKHISKALSRLKDHLEKNYYPDT